MSKYSEALCRLNINCNFYDYENKDSFETKDSDIKLLREGISKIEKYDELQTECEGYKNVIEGLKKSLDMKVNGIDTLEDNNELLNAKINTLVDGIKAILSNFSYKLDYDEDYEFSYYGFELTAKEEQDVFNYFSVSTIEYPEDFRKVKALLEIVEGKK